VLFSTAVLVRVLVELHLCDTRGKVFSHPRAELGCFPCVWHRAQQSQKGLGLFLLCVGPWHPRGEQARKAPAWLLLNGASGCVRAVGARKLFTEKNKEKKKIVLWTGILN